MRFVYHLPLSPNCRKVRLVLAEKRLPFELRVERVWERRPEYLEANPAGTVPTLLEDNGLAIPDSSVICEYLEEAYPDNSLLGQTLGERVEVRRLAAWFDGKFALEVTRNLNGEKYFKRLAGRGEPDAGLLRAGWLMVQSTSPAKSSTERCAAAAKSASEMVLPASHLRVSASQPR